MSERYKYCIVPYCTNTTRTAPDKLFIDVPRNDFLRKKWCKAMRRDDALNPKLTSTSTRHVCGDHFDLEKDMRNYMRYKLQGGKVFIKKGVVPHIFKCQMSLPVTPKGEKRKRLDIVARSMDAQPTASTSAAANLDVESDALDLPVTVKKEFSDKSIQYLKASCRDEALRVIQSISISDANFDIAWTLLGDGYSNKRDLLNAIIKKLLSQPTISESSSAISGAHIYKPYPDRTKAGNQPISLATRDSDVVFSSRT
ncbi:hypothetical protein AVEN_55789-1 [Araneus ventricosus]|uniref:THAP-type domain-containing protein n=1 Tax=Araneus ventricosus TaxID=182803 RepID=A0A4Y2EY75_ARAVE|nr:hypothetical protein AVEN_55789-1 [Araneus ventricosus]